MSSLDARVLRDLYSNGNSFIEDISVRIREDIQDVLTSKDVLVGRGLCLSEPGGSPLAFDRLEEVRNEVYSGRQQLYLSHYGGRLLRACLVQPETQEQQGKA